MKKKIQWVLLIILFIGIFTFGTKIIKYNKIHHITNDVSFDIYNPIELEKYLLSSTWNYSNNEDPYQLSKKKIFIKITDDLIYSTQVNIYDDKNIENSLGNINVLGSWILNNINYQGKSQNDIIIGNRDYLILIKEDIFRIRQCNNDSKDCIVRTYIKNEVDSVNLNGTYKFKGKTLIIQQLDNSRLSISGQVISEIPSYRFWIDEEDNIILFSDGIDVFDYEDEEVLAEYPFYKLIKQK